MASAARDRYLELLERDPSRSPADLCAEIGIKKDTWRTFWRADKPEFRAAEDKIRERWRQAQKRLRDAERAAQGGDRPAPAAPEGEGLDPRLARWLEVYEELDDRLGACRQLREEGIEITWEEVHEALDTNAEFQKRFAQLWGRGIVEAEDQRRRKARKGEKGELGAFLAAEMPKKYGPRVVVKHRFSGSVRLEPGDRQLVEDQEGWVKRYRQKATRALATRLAAEGAEVIEGQYTEIPTN